MPEAFLVDLIPVLKYGAEWMPGAGFRNKAKVWKEWAQKMIDAPFTAAQKEIVGPGAYLLVKGTRLREFSSFCPDVDESELTDYQRKLIKITASAVFVGM